MRFLKSWMLAAAAICVTGGVLAPQARAQANRNTTTARPSANTTAGVGEITGTERFLRDNRDPGAFVGAGGDEDFIGAATVDLSEVESAISGTLVREARPESVSIEKPRTTERTGMYSPRLRLSGAMITSLSAANPAQEQRRDREWQETAAQNQVLRGVNVSWNDGVATLRGRVASEEDRRVAELLVQLEPGVWGTRNELVVDPTLANDHPVPTTRASIPRDRF